MPRVTVSLMVATVWLLLGGAEAHARIDCMHRGGDALPADAHPVEPARAAELQDILDRHRRIRLDPAGDYRRATGITLRSGQAIFGAAGTRIGRIIVAPGTTGAILSGVVPDALEFPWSPLRTHGNCFERFAARYTTQAPLVLRNAVIEENLFLDVGRLVIDTASGGRVRNNRFIRIQVHGHAPALQLHGGGADSEDRNVFLWTNILSAPGKAIDIRGQGMVSLVGLDAENWNTRANTGPVAMLTARTTGTLRAAIVQGGDSKARPDIFMDVEARRFELVGVRLFRVGSPPVVAKTDDGEFVRAELGERGLGAEMAGKATPWEAPDFAPIADPAGPDWKQRRRKAVDTTAELQRQLDTQQIVRLPAGLFHVSASLRMKDGQAIVGAGAGRTAIVAMSDDIDLVVSADDFPQPRRTSFALIDLTLQGGRTGLRHDAMHAGAGAQFVHSQLSHVVFRDMTEAGIVIDGIYGWDNNLLDEVSFHRMPTGIVQRPVTGAAASGGNRPGINYLDKNVCYRCRFEFVETGMELLAGRANNLNACVNCRFVANRRHAVRLRHSNNTLVANSDFIDCSRSPIQSDQPVGVVSPRFFVDGMATPIPAEMLLAPSGLLVDWER